MLTSGHSVKTKVKLIKINNNESKKLHQDDLVIWFISNDHQSGTGTIL